MPVGNDDKREWLGKNIGWSGIKAEAVNGCQVETKQSDVLKNFIEIQKEHGIIFDTK